jgi:general secretion pathway protein C
MWKKHLWVKNLLFLCFLSYLLAKIGNTLLLAGLHPSTPYLSQTRSTQEADRKEPEKKSLRLYHPISQKNIFNSDYNGNGQGDSHRNTARNMTALKKADLNVRLMGTVVGSSQDSFAIVEDPQTRKQELYRVDDVIRDEARVVAISRCAVIVLRDGTEEILKCPEEESKKRERPASVRYAASSAKGESPDAKKPGKPPTVKELDESFDVEKLSEGEYVMDQSDVIHALNNVGTLLTQVRVNANFTDGKIDGVQFLGIMPDSLFAKAGLQEGDVIRRVNDTELSSVPQAFQAFHSLRNQSNLSIEIYRGGEKKSINYQIR